MGRLKITTPDWFKVESDELASKWPGTECGEDLAVFMYNHGSQQYRDRCDELRKIAQKIEEYEHGI